MPVNYRMEYALKAREAIDALGISAVINILTKHIGKHSSAEMTEAEVIEATKILDFKITQSLEWNNIRAEEWRKNWAEAEERDRWNAGVEKRKEDRQRRRNEKRARG